MANWSGTYAITAGTTGVATAATSTTLTNGIATFPTAGAGLTNFIIRILSGTGAGQERTITSNTATQVTVATWTVTPDTSSAYEIVLQWKNADHITAVNTYNSGIIFEIENNATVYVDGLYTITCNLQCTVRLNKTFATMPTIEPNNKTITGVFGAWSYISVSATCSIIPMISYIKMIGCAQFICVPIATGYDGSTVHHVWTEKTTTNAMTSTAMTQGNDITVESIFNRSSRTASLIFNATANAFKFIYKKCWIHEPSVSGISGPASLAGSDLMHLNRNVFRKAWTSTNVNVAAGKEQRVTDCYLSAATASEGIVLGSSTAVGDLGTHRGSRNVFNMGRAFYGPAGTGTASIFSAFNDFHPKSGSLNRAFELASATGYTAATSDNDYIAGTFLALPENIDTTAATSSAATPAQYINLTAARTNPKSVPNRPYELDNLSVGAYSGSQVTITFDCANGAVSGQGSTTVTTDSASGQPILNVGDSTGFEVGEIIEVGYGTVRFEELEVSAVGVGTITATSNLNFSHAAAQADTVKKQLRHYGLPFIKYGVASGVYDTRTPVPASSDWGLVFTGIQTSFEGVTHAWKQYGHSVTLKKLRDNTTYYFKAFAYDPLGNMLEMAESSFSTGTTASTDGYNSNCGLSINGSGEFQATLWLEQSGQPVTTGLTSASYTVYDEDDVAVSGLAQSGITPNGNGAFVITPVSASGLSGFSHYRMKVSVIHSTGTYESWYPFSIGEIQI